MVQFAGILRFGLWLVFCRCPQHQVVPPAANQAEQVVIGFAPGKKRFPGFFHLSGVAQQSAEPENSIQQPTNQERCYQKGNPFKQAIYPIRRTAVFHIFQILMETAQFLLRFVQSA